MKKNDVTIFMINIVCMLVLLAAVACFFVLLESTVLAIILSAAVALILIILNIIAIKYIPPKQIKPSALSIIAHEIRSPLTSVKGYLGAISDGTALAENHDACIKIASAETDRAIKLLENVMSLARFDSGRVTIHSKAFDINELIRSIVKSKEPLMSEKDISVEVTFENENENVIADPNLMQQVILNLIDNAIKYNRNGGTITVSTAKSSQVVSVSVKDTGTGIQKDMLEHIWDRFYQQEKSNSAVYKGHGLGLCVVKEIIDAHQQEISVQSTPGNGSVFCFTVKSAN